MTRRACSVSHYDLYRLKSARELDELGLDEALEHGAALIEWPERAPEAVCRPRRLHVRLRTRNGDARARDLTGPARWRESGHV